MHTIVSIKNVSKIYDKTRALNDVSLDIYKGEIFSLLGVNGAGKTTLSSILATLHPATSGDILFEGKSIYHDIVRYRMALGFCPQTQNLDAQLNVYDNLLYAGRYLLIPEDILSARIAELMQKLELTRYKYFDIDQLSGGTKQRVLIARALIHNPKIVILDEPTVGLDPDIRRKLWTIISDLKKQGITIIITTHYLDEAEVLSDRVCILHKGSIRLIESLDKLKDTHNMATLENIFLQFTQEMNNE